MSAPPEYPPKTARYLSWSALEFITRPSPRALAGVCGGIIGLLALAAAAVPFVKVNARVAADGEITAFPGALAAAAPQDGTVDARLRPAGASVVKGEPVAALQLGPGGELIPGLLARLSRNAGLLASLSAAGSLPRELETGASLDAFPDPAVRERAASLGAAARKLAQALRNHLEFAAPRDDVLNAGLALRGALAEYLEVRTVRAPAAGVLLQYEAPLHALVSRGAPVAIVLPREAALVASLSVDPQHASSLAVGQSVSYRLEAYPYERYGLFRGRVLQIEQSTDAQRGLLYVVRASIEPPARLPPALASGVRLMMGMRAQGSVVTGRRRLLDLALEALLGQQ